MKTIEEIYTLDEMIEEFKWGGEAASEGGFSDKLGKSVLSLLLELKQRREQDLTLEMVQFMQYMSNGFDCSFEDNGGQNFHCPEVGSCDEACTRTRLWLQEQEARLKGEGVG